MTTMHETVLAALRSCHKLIFEKDRVSPIFHEIDAACAAIGTDFMNRQNYIPTMDEAYRFIKSNPNTAADILAEIRQHGAVE